MKRNIKRVLAFTLTLVLLFGTFPIVAFSGYQDYEEPNEDLVGTGNYYEQESEGNYNEEEYDSGGGYVVEDTLPPTDEEYAATYVNEDEDTVFTVTFFDFDQYVFATQEVKAGDTAGKPSNEPEAGNSDFNFEWEFLGWFTDEEVLFDFNTAVESDLSLFAGFELIPTVLYDAAFLMIEPFNEEVFTVRFISGIGSDDPDVELSVSYGESLVDAGYSIPIQPDANTGWAFDRWSIDFDPTEPIYADVDVIAIWEPEVLVLPQTDRIVHIYYADYRIVVTTIGPGNSISHLQVTVFERNNDIPVYNGDPFAPGNTGNVNENYEVSLSLGNVVITIRIQGGSFLVGEMVDSVEVIQPGQFTVTFNPSPGDFEPELPPDTLNQNVNHGGFATVPPSAPVREGYDFLGWSRYSAPGIVNPGNIQIIANTTFVAQWEPEASDPFTGAQGTVNFPGVSGVTVTIWGFADEDAGSRSWINMGTFDDTTGIIDLPRDTQIIRAYKGSMDFRFEGLTPQDGEEYTFDVPTIPLDVTGLLWQNSSVGVLQPGWVYSNQAVSGESTTFNVFDNESPYTVRFDNGIFYPVDLVAQMVDDKLVADFTDYFYVFNVPAGFPNVRIATLRSTDGTTNRAWVINNAGPGTEIELFHDPVTVRYARADFVYGGQRHEIVFPLDGSNPFLGWTRVNFSGMRGVTLQYNSGPHNAWINIPGTFDDSAMIRLPVGEQRLRARIAVPANRVSQEVRVTVTEGDTSIQTADIPVKTIEISGIAIPGLNIDLRVAHEGNIGTLLSRVNAHQSDTLSVTTFDVGSELYNITIGGTQGFSSVIIRDIAGNINLTETGWFYSFDVPPGVTNVGIRAPNRIPLSERTADETITLLKTYQEGTLSFTYDGVIYTMPYTLDGSNPFVGTLVFVNFPGLRGVSIDYLRVGSGTPTQLGSHNDSAFFRIRDDHVLGTLRLRHAGAQYSFENLNNGNWIHVLNAPVETISIDNMVGRDGAMRVRHSNTGTWLDPYPRGATTVTLLDAGPFIVRFGVSLNGSGGNRHEITLHDIPIGTTLNRDEFVHSVIVPEGISDVRITCPVGSAITAFQILPRPFGAGENIDLPISHRNALLTYMFNGELVTRDFVLDGSNPFIRYAQYLEVVFNLDGGSYAGNQDLLTQDVRFGQNATPLTAPPTRTGYDFTGWNPALNLTNVTGNRTFTAQWEINPNEWFTVRFENWDGSEIATQSVVLGGTATAPANPNRVGYNFDGWYPTLNLTNVTGNRTFTAQWEINPAQWFDVEFVDWNGNVLAAQQVVLGGAATAPVAPTREGFTFSHWSMSFNNITANLTVTAVYVADSQPGTDTSPGGADTPPADDPPADDPPADDPPAVDPPADDPPATPAPAATPDPEDDLDPEDDPEPEAAPDPEPEPETPEEEPEEEIAEAPEPAVPLAFGSEGDDEMVIGNPSVPLTPGSQGPSPLYWLFALLALPPLFTVLWWRRKRTVEYVIGVNGESYKEKVRYGSHLEIPKGLISSAGNIKGWFQDSELKEMWNFDNDKIKKNIKLFAKLDQ